MIPIILIYRGFTYVKGGQQPAGGCQVLRVGTDLGWRDLDGFSYDGQEMLKVASARDQMVHHQLF